MYLRYFINLLLEFGFLSWKVIRHLIQSHNIISELILLIVLMPFHGEWNILVLFWSAETINTSPNCFRNIFHSIQLFHFFIRSGFVYLTFRLLCLGCFVMSWVSIPVRANSSDSPWNYSFSVSFYLFYLPFIFGFSLWILLDYFFRY